MMLLLHLFLNMYTGGYSGAYTFHGDPNKVFRDFFGGDNPFSGKFGYRY